MIQSQVMIFPRHNPKVQTLLETSGQCLSQLIIHQFRTQTSHGMQVFQHYFAEKVRLPQPSVITLA